MKPLKKTTKIKINRMIRGGIPLAIIISLVFFYFYRTIFAAVVSFLLLLLIFWVYLTLLKSFESSNRIKKIEHTFPDFLQLMSSNLRAGMTIDKAMLLSSRPEFEFLNKEILKTGKDITLGKNLEDSLTNMSKRIKSPSIEKTLSLINSGIRAGGNLAMLLDETALRMRQRTVLEKKATSSVLMYIIFIFIAASIFAPMLFGLSNVLVEILSKLFSGLPEIDSSSVNLPFSLSKISVSPDFIMYFSLTFMLIIDVLASLILGLISKGKEKEGMKYLPVILGLSFISFFVAKLFVANLMKGLF